jgi:hypothetical protein
MTVEWLIGQVEVLSELLTAARMNSAIFGKKQR